MAFNPSFDTYNWKRLWSVSEYENAFDEIFKQEGVLTEVPLTERIAVFPYHPSPTHKFLFDVTDSNFTIEEEIREQLPVIQQLHNLTRSCLRSRFNSESLVVRFDFPEETKIACEQYLLYFVQFLADVGVKATAELQHAAGHVLFTVTPESKNEALDKIRAALDLYLSIPLGNLAGDEVNIASQRLASNVYQLRSQLALAQAVTETVFDGLAEITKYQGKGFNINLPEIFRRLREYFERD